MKKPNNSDAQKALDAIQTMALAEVGPFAPDPSLLICRQELIESGDTIPLQFRREGLPLNQQIHDLADRYAAKVAQLERMREIAKSIIYDLPIDLLVFDKLCKEIDDDKA